MRVLLINPPFPFEEMPTAPLGLTSLAAYLLRSGVEVFIEDCVVHPHSRDRVRENLARWAPDVVGATAVTMNVKAALGVLGDYRREAPGLFTVMGGPHVTFDAQGILAANPFVDVVVRGEGEITFSELLAAVEAGTPLAPVQGISYRSEGGVVHNPDRPLMADLSDLPLPARHLVPVSRYRALGFPITMITSRGCPYECIFCVGRRMVGRKVRYLPVGRVLDEFEALVRMDFSQICIVDDLFTANQARCLRICDGILERGIVFPWSAFARVDTISPDLLARMKAAGCTSLCFGVESGNQGILDRIKKRTTVEQCRRAGELCQQAGIVALMSFILGLPGETPETVRESMAFGAAISKNFGFHILAPFPGTEVRERCDAYGMKILTDDWDLYDANHAVAHPGGIAPEEVERAANEFNREILDAVDEIEARKAAGGTLSDWEEWVCRGRFVSAFNRSLILERMVEGYPGVVNGAGYGRLRDDFVDYLAGRMGRPGEAVREQVDRLLALRCLQERVSEAGTRLDWA